MLVAGFLLTEIDLWRPGVEKSYKKIYFPLFSFKFRSRLLARFLLSQITVMLVLDLGLSLLSSLI